MTCAPFIALGQTDKNFCTHFDTIEDRLQDRMDARLVQIEELRMDKEFIIEKQRGDIDAELDEKRVDADEKRARHYASIARRVSASDMEESFVVFKEAVEEAIIARRVAVDAALTTYRMHMDTTRETHRKNLVAAHTRLSDTVDSAKSIVKSACAQGAVPVAKIQADFEYTLRTAQDAYKASVLGLTDTARKAHEDLARKRKKDIDATLTSFTKTLEDARLVFKTSIEN